jgi:topoisomerase IV subunit B
VKITPEDVWARCSYVLSVRLSDPQFTGQTKDRLSSREACGVHLGSDAGRIQPLAESQHRLAEKIAHVAIDLCTGASAQSAERLSGRS